MKEMNEMNSIKVSDYKPALKEKQILTTFENSIQIICPYRVGCSLKSGNCICWCGKSGLSEISIDQSEIKVELIKEKD